MNILNYSSFLKTQPTLTEVLGELLPVYNLELYEELGKRSIQAKRATEAIVWFTKGLAMARELRDSYYIDLFKSSILENIDEQ